MRPTVATLLLILGLVVGVLSLTVDSCTHQSGGFVALITAGSLLIGCSAATFASIQRTWPVIVALGIGVATFLVAYFAFTLFGSVGWAIDCAR